jgi:hypothetical protein
MKHKKCVKTLDIYLVLSIEARLNLYRFTSFTIYQPPHAAGRTSRTHRQRRWYDVAVVAPNIILY